MRNKTHKQTYTEPERVKNIQNIPGKQNPEAGISILFSNKSNFKTKLIRRCTELACMLVNETMSHRDNNFYKYMGPRIGAHNFIKQSLLNMRGQRNPNTILTDDF